jgi:adenylate kinase family enzyme
MDFISFAPMMDFQFIFQERCAGATAAKIKKVQRLSCSKFVRVRSHSLLVFDGRMIDLIAEWITHPDYVNGFILDRFPRAVPQAIALHELLSQSVHSSNHMFPQMADSTKLSSRGRVPRTKKNDDGGSPN